MPETTSEKLHILIADDETATTFSVSFVLKRAGHEVDAVPDGMDALARLKEAPARYQVLITDHAMTRMTGLELVKQLRGTAFHGGIVVMSGFLTPELMDDYRNLGVHKIIAKPFDVAELRKAVEEAGAGMCGAHLTALAQKSHTLG